MGQYRSAMRLALPLVLVLAAGPALAQFKCTQADGSVSFQQQPCAAQARAERLALLPPVPDDGRAEFRADAARGVISVGMTRTEVDLAMRGAPDKINRSVVNGRRHDQLIYETARGPAYLYLDNGVLTSWQYSPKE